MLKRPNYALNPAQTVVAREAGYMSVDLWWFERDTDEPFCTFDAEGVSIAGLHFASDGELWVLSTDGLISSWDISDVVHHAEREERAGAPNGLRAASMEEEASDAQDADDSEDTDDDESGDEDVGGDPVEADDAGTVDTATSEAGRAPKLRWRIQLSSDFVTTAEHAGILAAGDAFGRVWLIEPEGEAARVRIGARRHRDAIVALRFSDDGRQLASSGRDRRVKLWDSKPLTSGMDDSLVTPSDVLQFFNTEGSVAVEGESPSPPEFDASLDVDESSAAEDEPRVADDEPLPDDDEPPLNDEGASADENRPAELPFVRTLRGMEGWQISVAFSHDGTRLATGGIDAGVYLWRLNDETDQPAEVRFAHAGWVSDLEFSPDDTVIATASWDTTVGLFGGGDLQPIVRFELHRDYIADVEFVDDVLVAASHDGESSVWNWRSNTLETTLEGHVDWVEILHPLGGERVASIGADRTVRIWNIATGTAIRVIGRSDSLAGFEVGAPVDLSEYVDTSELASYDLEERETRGRYRDYRASGFRTTSDQTALALLESNIGSTPAAAQSEVSLFEASIPDASARVLARSKIPSVDDVDLGELPEPKPAGPDVELDVPAARQDESTPQGEELRAEEPSETELEERSVEQPEPATPGERGEAPETPCVEKQERERGDEPEPSTPDAERKQDAPEPDTPHVEEEEEEQREEPETPDAEEEEEQREEEPETPDVEEGERRQEEPEALDVGERVEPDVAEPDIEEPEPEEPEIEEPEPEAPDIEEPEPEEPEIEEPEPEAPDIEEPEPDRPGTEEPEIGNREPGKRPTNDLDYDSEWEDLLTGHEALGSATASRDVFASLDPAESNELTMRLGDETSTRLETLEKSEAMDEFSDPPSVDVGEFIEDEGGLSDASVVDTGEEVEQKVDPSVFRTHSWPKPRIETPEDQLADQTGEWEMSLDEFGADEPDGDEPIKGLEPTPDEAPGRDPSIDRGEGTDDAPSAVRTAERTKKRRTKSTQSHSGQIWERLPSRAIPAKQLLKKQARPGATKFERTNAIRTPHQFVYGVAVSPDGRRIATCGGDNSMCVWTREGDQLHRVRVDTDGLNALDFSLDGRAIVAGGDDCIVHLWLLPGREDPDEPIRHAALRGHDGWISSVSFSADGSFVFTGSYDGTARVWRLSTGRCVRKLSTHEGAVSGVAIGTTRAYTVGHDGALSVWNQKWIQIDLVGGHDRLLGVASNGDNTVFCAANGEVFILREGHPMPLLRHRGQARAVHVRGDGAFFSAGEDGHVRVYPADNDIPTQSLPVSSPLWCVDASHDIAAAGADDGFVYIFGADD